MRARHQDPATHRLERARMQYREARARFLFAARQLRKVRPGKHPLIHSTISDEVDARRSMALTWRRLVAAYGGLRPRGAARLAEVAR